MSLPEKGRKLPLSALDNSEAAELAGAIARALRSELGARRAMVKVIGRWTGASDRAIKEWLAGRAVPNGLHLIGLMRYSEAVTRVVLSAAGRGVGLAP